jgi:hypothetical protein
MMSGAARCQILKLMNWFESGSRKRALRNVKSPPSEIIDRCICALRASDFDIIYLNGYGFPAHRGGPMWYADTGGLKQVLRASLRIPSPAWRNLEARPATFADFGKEEGAAA